MNAGEVASATDTLKLIHEEFWRLSRTAASYRNNATGSRAEVAEAVCEEFSERQRFYFSHLGAPGQLNAVNFLAHFSADLPPPLTASVRAVMGMPRNPQLWPAPIVKDASSVCSRAISSYTQAFARAYTLSDAQAADGFAALQRKLAFGRYESAYAQGLKLAAAKPYLPLAERQTFRQPYAQLWLSMAQAANVLGRASQDVAFWAQKRHKSVKKGSDSLRLLDLMVFVQLIERLLLVAKAPADAAVGEKPLAAHAAYVAARDAWNLFVPCLDAEDRGAFVAVSESDSAERKLGEVSSATRKKWYARLFASHAVLRQLAQDDTQKLSGALAVPCAALQESSLRLLRKVVPRNGYAFGDYVPTPPVFAAVISSLQAAQQRQLQRRQHLLVESPPGEGKTEGLWALLSHLCAESRAADKGRWIQQIWACWPDKGIFYDKHFSASEAKIKQFFDDLVAEADSTQGLVVLVLDEVQVMLAKDRSSRTIEDEKVMTSFLSYLDQSSLPVNIVVVATTNDSSLLAPPARDRFTLYPFAAPPGVYYKVASDYTNATHTHVVFEGEHPPEALTEIVAGCLAYSPPRQAVQVVAQTLSELPKPRVSVGEAMVRILFAAQQAIEMRGNVRREASSLFYRQTRNGTGVVEHRAWQAVDALKAWQDLGERRTWQLLDFTVSPGADWAMVAYLGTNLRAKAFSFQPSGKRPSTIEFQISAGPERYGERPGEDADVWALNTTGHQKLFEKLWRTAGASDFVDCGLYPTSTVQKEVKLTDVLVFTTRFTPPATQSEDKKTVLHWLNEAVGESALGVEGQTVKGEPPCPA